MKCFITEQEKSELLINVTT